MDPFTRRVFVCPRHRGVPLDLYFVEEFARQQRFLEKTQVQRKPAVPGADKNAPRVALTTSTLTAMPRYKNLEFHEVRRKTGGPGGKEGWHSVTEG